MTSTTEIRSLCPEGVSLFERHPPHFLTAVYIRLSKLRLPRWSLVVVTGLLALGCMALVAWLPFPQFEKGIFLFGTHMCTLWLSMLLLLPAVAVGRIASRGGSRRDGDVAMAIFASYAIGQFMPLFY